MLFARIVRIMKSNGNTASKQVAMHQKPGIAAAGKKRLSRRRGERGRMDKRQGQTAECSRLVSRVLQRERNASGVLQEQEMAF